MSRRFTVRHSLDGADEGTVLSEDDLDGVNVAALLASGHLEQLDGEPVEMPEQVQTAEPVVDTIATEPPAPEPEPEEEPEGAGE